MNGKKLCEVAMIGGSLVLSLASMEAMATAACAAGVGTSITGTSTAFIKTGFNMKCSSNVDVDYTDSGAALGVRGRSAKGRTLYGGSSEGGSVSVCTVGPVSAPAVGTATATAGCN